MKEQARYQVKMRLANRSKSEKKSHVIHNDSHDHSCGKSDY